MNESGLSEDERIYYKDFLTANTEVFKPSDGSREEFQKYLGSPVETPLGQVRMGANQYSKFIEKKRGSLFIAARETLERPLLIFKAENGTVVYVKSFASEDGKKRNVISATIEREDVKVAITTHEERLNQILGKIKKTSILYEKAPGL